MPWLGTISGLLGAVALVLLLGQSGSQAQAVWSPVLTPLTMTASATESSALPEQLVVMGRTVGIKMFSDGVLVVGQSGVETADGKREPGKTAGIKTGDIITHLEGTEVNTIEEIQSILSGIDDNTVDLSILRGDSQLNLTVEPAVTVDGIPQMGLWLRDSMAGIGTITYCDPTTGQFVALGHGVNDVDTAMLMPLEHGTIMFSSVAEVLAGTAGTPGELHGSFDLSRDLGTLNANTETGLYGILSDQQLLEWGQVMDVATRDQVVEGPATIRTNVEGDVIEEFDIEITEIYSIASGNTKNMMVTVTDPRILELTGGIVQGMSGSPIIQNGKLVGAVTHVLVNDPTSGYGILIENMLETGAALEESNVA